MAPSTKKVASWGFNYYTALNGTCSLFQKRSKTLPKKIRIFLHKLSTVTLWKNNKSHNSLIFCEILLYKVMTVCACACKKQYENHKMRVYTQKNNFIKEKQNSNEGKLFILFYNPPTVDNYEPTYRLTRKCRLLFCFILSSDALSFLLRTTETFPMCLVRFFSAIPTR